MATRQVPNKPMSLETTKGRADRINVPLLDLTLQYSSIKQEVRSAIEEVLESQHFILGPKVEALEEAVAEYCGCERAVGVSSGTDALIIALMAAGIGPGHGVITAPFTFFATAGSIVRVGAQPLFVDIDPLSCNIDPQAVRTFVDEHCHFDLGARKLVHRQSGVVIHAIMPIHLYGQCADMDPIVALARQYGLIVIEDAAQAIGAGYPSAEHSAGKRAGSLGELGCFSFFPTKNLGGFGDGGMVTTNDQKLAEKLKILRVHGSKPKYYHRVVGGNFRLDALQAAVVLVKLRYLDGWTAKRRENAAYYNSLFQQTGLVDKGLIAPPAAVWESKSSEPRLVPRSSHLGPPQARLGTRDSGLGTRDAGRGTFFHIYNQYVIRARRRDELREYLAKQAVGTEVYYPLSLHQQECFAVLGYSKGDFPHSEEASTETLALPIYPELEREQLEYVVGKIDSFYRGN
jgi:dTDP-4-amino-4,6-dideoxygalactose transaminase